MGLCMEYYNLISTLINFLPCEFCNLVTTLTNQLDHSVLYYKITAYFRHYTAIGRYLSYYIKLFVGSSNNIQSLRILILYKLGRDINHQNILFIVYSLYVHYYIYKFYINYLIRVTMHCVDDSKRVILCSILKGLLCDYLKFKQQFFMKIHFRYLHTTVTVVWYVIA